MNKNLSLLMAELETCAGNNTVTIPYKIDRGSEGNSMLWHIFKKLFKNITEGKLKGPLKGI